ncbi:GNAT family N-acetyltransferase [Paucisalibacillus sp. EB02]|uniref:GNAT family N-acetyltransferase n=1 Tax=Paucisalibacillus sp. EB02 TaxID=1347087 RepID=UPI0005A9E272|nr:GNAT family N-acetyltransferase [Paucisalibacillus sp. EB02]
MISFVKKIDIEQQKIDKKIFNSNIEYNQIAYDKKYLVTKDIELQYEEAATMKLERYIVQLDSKDIGIIEYGMSSPRAGRPWLSLLIIDKKYQGLGYARDTYIKYENIMRNNQVDIIQIAVHATNSKALEFWKSVGFSKYDERYFEEKYFYSMEKRL